jgi:hypothetical protein
VAVSTSTSKKNRSTMNALYLPFGRSWISLRIQNRLGSEKRYNTVAKMTMTMTGDYRVCQSRRNTLDTTMNTQIDACLDPPHLVVVHLLYLTLINHTMGFQQGQLLVRTNSRTQGARANRDCSHNDLPRECRPTKSGLRRQSTSRRRRGSDCTTLLFVISSRCCTESPSLVRICSTC